jgi:hypothetical protein
VVFSEYYVERFILKIEGCDVELVEVAEVVVPRFVWLIRLSIKLAYYFKRGMVKTPKGGIQPIWQFEVDLIILGDIRAQHS